MFRLLKKVVILTMSLPLILVYCLLLKNQECTVRKVIIDNDYMTFPYKIKVDKCIGSCNDKDNPYFKVCLPDSIKNISVKSFDLISRKTAFKSISFHQNCKCCCLLDEKVCNNLQKWNVNKCRCICLKIKDCGIGYSWNVNNCRCEMKKLASLIKSERFLKTEECDVETDKIIKCKTFSKNKTVTLIKRVKDCKPFIAVSVLFPCISIILIGIMIYFCLKLKECFTKKKIKNLFCII